MYYSSSYPPITTSFNGTLNATEAVQACATAAFDAYPDPNEYLSFDLHFVAEINGTITTAGEWECVMFFSEQGSDDGVYFNVSDSVVTVAYGFSSPLYYDGS